jgi:hypothetical protein
MFSGTALVDITHVVVTIHGRTGVVVPLGAGSRKQEILEFANESLALFLVNTSRVVHQIE